MARSDKARSSRRRAGRRLHTAPGTQPGAIRAPPQAEEPQLRLMSYDQGEFEELDDADLAAIDDWHGRRGVLWIDLNGVADTELLEALATRFRIHPLAMEDVAHLGQRPKVEAYDDCLLVVLDLIHLEPEPHHEQISIVIGRDWVLSVQERPGDPFEPLRRRIRTQGTTVRRAGPDHLAYALIDAVVDSYFLVTETLAERLDELEEELFNHPGADLPERIRLLKRQFLEMRRSVRPLREALASLYRDDHALILPYTRTFLRDCYDHAIHVLDQLDMFHELATDQLSTYLSAQGNRLNEVMRVLTVIATVFLPLSFVASLYGMNFDRQASPWNMPELGWRFGYPMSLALMAAIAVAMLAGFRRRGWLGPRPARREASKR